MTKITLKSEDIDVLGGYDPTPDAAISVSPYQPFILPGRIVTTAVSTLKLGDNGQGDVFLDPSPAGTAYKFAPTGMPGMARQYIVVVPNAETISFSTLIKEFQVDPVTLLPTEEPTDSAWSLTANSMLTGARLENGGTLIFTRLGGGTINVGWVKGDKGEPGTTNAEMAAYVGATGPTKSALIGLLGSRRVYNVKDYGALGNNLADDTTAWKLAKAAAAAAGGGTVYFPTGIYRIRDIVIQSGIHLDGDGPGASQILAHPTSTVPGLVTLPLGITYNSNITNLSFLGNGVAGQHGLYMHALTANENETQGTAGWWNSTVRNVRVGNFAGDQIWLRGGGDEATRPIQFLSLENVFLDRSVGSTRACLRATGQVNQVRVVGGYWDGDTGNTVGSNLVMGPQVNDDLTTKSNKAPHTWTFQNWTSQNAAIAAQLALVSSITFDTCHFENLISGGVFASTSASAVRVQDSHFANAATGGAANASCVRASSGANVVAGGNTFIGTNTRHYMTDGGSASVASSAPDFTSSLITQDLTGQLTVPPTGILPVGGRTNALVNTSATPITSITGSLAPGSMLILQAWGGPITLAAGGNIYLAGKASPLVIPQYAVAMLTRLDKGSTGYVLVSVSA